MATTSKKTTSFDVICPCCHSADDTVMLDLNDLGECRCSGCDETFTAAEARDLVAAELARWEKVCRWVQMGRELAAEVK